MNRVKFLVSAYHNVEDFRPYKVSFVNRRSLKENVKQALFLTIKREGGWNGWFEKWGELGGNRTNEIKSAIEKAVETAYKRGGTKEAVIYGVDTENDGDVTTPTENHGLVVWVRFSKKKFESNFGFGYGNTTQGKGPLSSNDTDKYHNKWVEKVS